MKLEISRQTLEKHSDIKFHENPSSGSRTVPCRRKDMTQLIVAFRRFENAPMNETGEDRKTGKRDFIELVEYGTLNLLLQWASKSHRTVFSRSLTSRPNLSLNT
jgi:hypothetical protein